MVETTSRGHSESVLDPSNPSVNKQTMLAWLRINHPMTPIKSNATKAEIANKVREAQPHVFGTVKSSAVTSILPVVYPPMEKLQVSSPNMANSFETSEKIAKRFPSEDLEVPYPHKRIGNLIAIPPKPMEARPKDKRVVSFKDGSRNLIKKKALTNRSKFSKATKTNGSPPLKPNVSDWTKFCQSSSQNTLSSSHLNEDHTHELQVQGLKQFNFTPLIDQNCSGDNFSLPSRVTSPGTNPRSLLVDKDNSNGPSVPNKSHSTSKARANQPEDESNAVEVDLIQFSDTEEFEVGNLVIGRDIPEIKIQKRSSSSNKKTGVDIFQEQQQRDQKVQSLEERLAHLESSIDLIERKASMSLFEEVQKQQADANTIKQLESLLEQSTEDISRLEGRVRLLEVETTDLQTELDTAFATIECHRRVFKKILGPDSHIKLEEEYDSDPEEHEESSSPKPDSCNNDSPVSE